MSTESFPTQIGRYQVVSLLGSGAMGNVWLAEDPLIKRKVAIKTIRLDLVQKEEDRINFLARFSREAEISGFLKDPGIVAIHDVGDSDLGPFMAMEYLKGKSLDQYPPGGTSLTHFQKLRILAGTARALDNAHAAGIIHRDVKPGNVMILESGLPVVMDFGIAKQENSVLTQTGMFMGTPSYVSPEQVRGAPIDCRSDLFSFAVMTFELLTGVLPFPGNSINTILYNIVHEPPVEAPPKIPGILPDHWHAVFDRGLAKSPKDRHPTCSAFVQDLLQNCVETTEPERISLGSILQVDVSGLAGASTARTAPSLHSLARRDFRKKLILSVSAIMATLIGGLAILMKPGSGLPKVETDIAVSTKPFSSSQDPARIDPFPGKNPPFPDGDAKVRSTPQPVSAVAGRAGLAPAGTLGISRNAPIRETSSRDSGNTARLKVVVLGDCLECKVEALVRECFHAKGWGEGSASDASATVLVEVESSTVGGTDEVMSRWPVLRATVRMTFSKDGQGVPVTTLEFPLKGVGPTNLRCRDAFRKELREALNQRIVEAGSL